MEKGLSVEVDMYNSKKDDIDSMLDLYKQYENSFSELNESCRTSIENVLWKKNGLTHQIIPFYHESNTSGRYVAGKPKRIAPSDKKGFVVEYLRNGRMACSERYITDSFADPITLFISDELSIRYHYFGMDFTLDSISKVENGLNGVTSALSYDVEHSSKNPPFSRQQITRFDYSYGGEKISSFDIRRYICWNSDGNWSESITRYVIEYCGDVAESLMWISGEKSGVIKIK